MVEAAAEAFQVHPDLAAAMALGVLSAACSGAEVEARDDWVEPAALWVMPVAYPGEGKGPLLSALAAPLERAEAERLDNAREWVAVKRADHESARRRLSKAQDRAAAEAAGVAEREAVARAAEELERTPYPSYPRLLLDDATPEAVVSHLVGGPAAVLSDEGAFVENSAGARYSASRAPNISGVLKAWSRQPIRVDRKGRDAELVEKPVLTLCIAVQPIVCHEMLGDPVLVGRGFPARFLVAFPETRLGTRRAASAPIPLGVSSAWAELITELVSPSAKTAEHAEPGFARYACQEVRLRMDSDARAQHEAFFESVEGRCGPEGDLRPVSEWAGKLRGQVIRVAGVLHFAEHGSGAPGVPIGRGTMRAAVELVNGFIGHFLCAAGLSGPGGFLASDAQRVLDWVRRSGYTHFTERDAFSANRTSTRSKVSDWRPVFTLLVDLGYLRQREPESSSRGGRPSVVYDVNPAVHLSEAGEASGS